MHRSGNVGLRLDLTENTPDGSANPSHLPNLVVEHAESLSSSSLGQSLHQGESLNPKLPNLVEGSMDYGGDRRSSRYLADQYDASAPLGNGYKSAMYNHQDMPTSALNYGVAESGYLDRNYLAARSATSTYDRKAAAAAALAEREALERYEASLAYERNGLAEHMYRDSEPDGQYDRSASLARSAYDLEEATRRYSRDLTDYDYGHYAEETLKLEAKKSGAKVSYEVATTQGFDSGLKTNSRENVYDLASQRDLTTRANYQAAGKIYGTLPRYEAVGGARYDNGFDRSAAANLSMGSGRYDTTGRAKVYEGVKYELTTSRSSERFKHENATPSPRYPDSANSYEHSIKESSSEALDNYSKKSKTPMDEQAGSGGGGVGGGQEKVNGYRKNNFEAYGVYADQEEDHGFTEDKKTPNYACKRIVVNASGKSSVVDQRRIKEQAQAEMHGSPWCKPTILLLLLVLLVVTFVLIAGVILYINCE
ncbi:hypothetical protein QAD02_024260 [Eretmocerus hayati]|uniref:Uncharacterized protein n=1 Tax=Eretmocerus hayati TaxID=131215 RepID=A0ACC2PXY1_9HYME|nr:hypothetical protein QAD02_024260 [Eretmocerus hayati]